MYAKTPIFLCISSFFLQNGFLEKYDRNFKTIFCKVNNKNEKMFVNQTLQASQPAAKDSLGVSPLAY